MADKNVPSVENTNEKKNVALKEVETKPKKAKGEPWTAKRILTTVIIAILALLMVGSLYYIIVLVNQDKSEKANAWGTYDGTPITIENNNVFYNTLMSDSNFQNAYLTGDYNTLFSSYYNAYQQQVLYTAISAEAKKAGIRAPQTLVNDLIISSGVYNGDDGKFSEEVFNNTSEASRILVNNYYAGLYPYQTVLTDIGSAIVSDQEKEFVAQTAGKTRSLEYFTIDYNAYPNDLAAEYGQANADLFKSLDISTISNSSEDQVKAAYEALNSGSAWNDAVSLYSQDSYASNNGAVGNVMLFAIASSLSDSADLDKIVATEVGSYTEPIKVSYGWAIYRVDTGILPADFTNETTLASVKYYINTNEAETINAYVQSIVDTTAELAKTDFEAAAESCNATIVTINAASDNIGESQYIQGLDSVDTVGNLSAAAKDEGISREIFTADEGYVTSAMSTDNGYVVAKVTGVNDSNASLSSLARTFYNYYSGTQAVYDKFYAIFASEKFTDNFYSQFLTQLFSSSTSSVSNN